MKINVKKTLYIISAIGLIVWAVFRFSVIQSENSRQVFNATRIAQEQGVPVNVMMINKKTDFLKESLFIKNNRALVSSARVSKFRAGQKIGRGKIISVSQNIDLDSGMHIVETYGVPDGLNYAEFENVGFFVPVYAISENSVMVVNNGIAEKHDIKISDQDSQNAVITNGLSDGDMVILSKISEGDKVKIEIK